MCLDFLIEKELNGDLCRVNAIIRVVFSFPTNVLGAFTSLQTATLHGLVCPKSLPPCSSKEY